MAVKTKEWLLNFKADAPQKERKDKIDEILAGLQTEKFAEERVNDQEYLTVFPLGSTFTSLIALTDQHQDFLLVVSNNNRKILSAKVGRFVSEEVGKQTTPQSFLDFYNKQNPGADGKYYFLSLAGNHLYDFTFKDGNRISGGLVTYKSPESNNVARLAARCYAYYLVTTYYHPDGTTTQDREYLYTLCDPTDPQLPQPDEGGGGSLEVVDELSISRQESWHAFYGDVYGTWATIWATDRLKGKRVQSEPGGGHFTGIAFQGLACNTQNILYDYTLSQQNYSGQTATSRIKAGAALAQPTTPWTWDDRTKTYSFQAVFP
jgi:hypothetical protein